MWDKRREQLMVKMWDKRREQLLVTIGTNREQLMAKMWDKRREQLMVKIWDKRREQLMMRIWDKRREQLMCRPATRVFNPRRTLLSRRVAQGYNRQRETEGNKTEDHRRGQTENETCELFPFFRSGFGGV
ncbi:hypothetical protein Btru_018357 [Bulinus truncatus]|nr:hypothetical protein Btru_018357 [Bulinus truncatus]